ncbi:hypothetical protein NPIL_71111 [Nephila pilipes]|uniref:Uncharacterized protein n=1 Tax=Nephila pilipes TaxID=299642 RepID=A0A8X6MUM7_NEPPI|nr:hypothetical protein NPIL_71111 [Nephila pilipes]
MKRGSHTHWACTCRQLRRTFALRGMGRIQRSGGKSSHCRSSGRGTTPPQSARNHTASAHQDRYNIHVKGALVRRPALYDIASADTQ